MLLHGSSSSRFFIDMSLLTCVAIGYSFSTFTVLGKGNGFARWADGTRCLVHCALLLPVPGDRGELRLTVVAS